MECLPSDGFSFCFPMVSTNNVLIYRCTSHRLSGEVGSLSASASGGRYREHDRGAAVKIVSDK